MELDVREIGCDFIHLIGESLSDNGIKALRVGDNDFTISVKRSENPHIAPNILISVGSRIIGLIQEVKFRACANNLIPEIEVTVLAPEVWDGIDDKDCTCQPMAKNSIEELKKLLPFITIKEIDVNGDIVRVQGRDLGLPSSMCQTDHVIKSQKEDVPIITRVSTIDVAR